MSPENKFHDTAERLVPIEVPDENEESGFRVVLAVDLTGDD